MKYRKWDSKTKAKIVPESPQNNLSFLTNNFTLPATTIALIYKSRWQVELFFKWTKHLRIRTFYITSENSVRTQNKGVHFFNKAIRNENWNS